MASEKKALSLKEKYPEIYAQKDIDRRGYKRVVPMEILSLSLGRTGTMCECFFVVRFTLKRIAWVKTSFQLPLTQTDHLASQQDAR